MPRKRLTFRILALALIVVFSIFLLFRVVLLTRYPADALGSLLSEYTGLKVTVGGVAWVSGALQVAGITIENPSGFRERNLLSVRSLRVAPDPGVLTAKRHLSLLEIQGVKLSFEKNPSGAWNFAHLLRRLRPAKKQPSRELFIRRLVLRDVDLLVNGRAIDNLSLTVNDLSTKGTTGSRLVLSLSDAEGSPVLLTAEGRIGSSPVLHARLQAARFSLSPLAAELPPGVPVNLEQARSTIDLTAEMSNQRLSARGRVGFAGLGLRLGSEARQLRGGLVFSGRYDTAEDHAVLERADLTVNGLVSLKAAGSMERVRKDGSFVLTLSHDPIALTGLMGMLPEKTRRGFAIDGTIVSRGLRLEGSRERGIVAGRADVSLHSARLARHGRVLLSRGGADLSMRRMAAGWMMNGRIFAAGATDGLIDSLDAPFTVRLTSNFKPERVAFPAVAAAVAGGRLTGGFSYFPDARPRFRGNCAIRNMSLVSLNRYLAGATTRLSSGTGSATVSLTGNSPGEFAGRFTVTLTSAAGLSAGKKVALGRTALISRVRRKSGGLSADGRLEIAGGAVNGRPFSASSDLSLAGSVLKLAKADMVLGGSRARIGAAAVRLPTGGEGKAGGGLPFAATLAGGELRSGSLIVEGLSGKLDCRYFPAGEEGRLDGGGFFTVGSLSYRDRKAASLAGRISFGGREISARIRGESLGGKLDASVTTVPFSREKETTFSVRLREQQLERLSIFLPKNKGQVLSGGRADVSLDGFWGRTSGVRGRLELAGRDISLRGSGNRTLLSGFGLSLAATVAGPDLQLKEAVLKREGGPVLRAGGEVKRFTGADREGSLKFSMAPTHLNTLLDAFANSLPRNLQEAAGGGTCDLEGSLTIKGNGLVVDGGLALKAASLEIPSQKVLVADIDGRIPFSLAFPHREPARSPSSLSFSRENYTMLLQSFGRNAGTGSRLRIGKARFGALEIGEMTFFMTAKRGLIEIAPLRVSLYDGYLTGIGFLLYGNGIGYGADLLLHDLSLRELCESFPKIKGYMSGRVDGVVSLLNSEGGAGSAAGYVNLWSRSGKGEQMLVSKEFLQKLAGKKLRGFLFRNDRAYDRGEIIAYLKGGFLTFERLDISHTNLLGMKDLNVTVAPVQNRIAVEHLLESIREAAARGKGKGEEEAPPVQTDLKWLE